MSAPPVFVDAFRQILLWPLRLPEVGDAQAIGAPWSRVETPLAYLADDDTAPLDRHGYGEFLYFHPFVRSLLFDRADPRPITLYRRTDLAAMQVCLHHRLTGSFSVTFSVERLHFYRFAGGCGMLAVELLTECPTPVEPAGTAPCRMTLNHALVILERLRRAYPPFYDDDALPGLSPVSVRWIDQEGAVSLHPAVPLGDALQRVSSDGAPPVFSHWRDLAPLPFAEKGGLRHIIDDRIPHMVYLAVDRPALVERGDWIRLALADDCGDDPLPYAEDFLQGFEAAHCYDRFWTGRTGSRILCSGFGFAMVGDSGDKFFRDVLVHHFRRHYFQMALISHYQLASLLVLSDRLAHAAGSTKTLRSILRDHLQFTHRAWFPDISNQVQARELFTLWRRHLGVETLYDQTLREVQAANDHMDAAAEADMAAAEADMADAAMRLNMLASVGLVLALTTGFLGMNTLVGGKPDWTSGTAWGQVLVTLGGFSLLGGGGLWFLGSPVNDRNRPLRRLSYGLLVFGLLSAILGAWLWCFSG